MRLYPYAVDNAKINTFAWDMFEFSSSASDLRQAASWMKRILDARDGGSGYYYDTYANILYKLNKSDKNAISLQAKALTLLPGREKAAAEARLKEMEKGQPTWTE
jgi:hypothetical protein